MPLDTDTDSLNAAAFSQHSDDVFGRIATRYDMLCDLFSLGIHRIWKREVARQIAKERWSTLLGGATGTGHILLRVLQHGVSGERTIVGSDIVLEASNIPWRPLHAAYLAYMSLCMPVVGWLATGGDASAYRYLLQGIRDFPTAEDLAQELIAHGFEAVRFRRLSFWDRRDPCCQKTWRSGRRVKQTDSVRLTS